MRDGSICVFMVAYAAGRRARIAGLPRGYNPHHLPILPIGLLAYAMARVHNSWDAGWMFGERAALAAHEERECAA